VAEKEVKYCEHVKAETARPYMRLSGQEYDLIVCWTCQNQAAPYVEKLNSIAGRLNDLTKMRSQGGQR